MQTITVYLACPDNGNPFAVRDYANARDMRAPVIVRGCPVTLLVRLFAGPRGAKPYPIADLQAPASWNLRVDRDYDATTPSLLSSDETGASVSSVTETGPDGVSRTYSQISVPVSLTDTEPLARALGADKGLWPLVGELTGYGQDGEPLLVVQFGGLAVRNVIGPSATPTPVDPDWLNATQVEALVSTCIPSSEKGVPNGVPTLGEDGLVPESQLPEIGTSTDVQINGTSITVDGVANIVTGEANGVAPLDANSKVPTANLPTATSSVAGTVRADGNSGVTISQTAAYKGFLYTVPASEAQINAKTHSYNPIVPSRLNYAVRSVLPNVTTIPPATSEYTLLDSSATTNSHSHTYRHAPETAPTYTLPTVTDATVSHLIVLTVDFTTVQTLSFVDSGGETIAMQYTPTIAANDVYTFRCEYSAVQSKWLIYPVREGGAQTNDFVLKSEVGQSNGVAPLDADALVPEANLPVATVSQLGIAKANAPKGTSIYDNGIIGLANMDNNLLEQRSTTNIRAITTASLNKAVTAALTDANHITLNATQQTTAKSVLGVIEPLILDAAPTTSTVGKIGQLAVDTATSKTYHCTAVTTSNDTTTYTWTDDVNAKGGKFTGNVTLNSGNNCLRIGAASGSGSYSFAIGISGTKATGWYSTALGQNTSAAGQDSIAAGHGASTTTNAQAAFGKWTATSNTLAFVVGNGTANNNRLNIGELSWGGDFYIAGGYQQRVVTIPAATTAYTFAEGSFRHSPSAAPTYTLPDVTVNTRTHEIVVEVAFTGYVRSSDDDSGSAYAWKAGTSLLYTDTTTPTAGTTVAYTDTALTTSAGTIAAYDSTSTSIALIASCEFEDANEETITPMSTPDIKPGTVVAYLCRWTPGADAWVICPLVLKEGALA